MSTFFDSLVADMRDSLQAIEENILKGNKEGAANILLSFAEDVSRAGDTAELLLEEE